MKKITIIALTLIGHFSYATDFITKRDFILQKQSQPQSYSSELRICVDVESGHVLPAQNCYIRDEVRKCIVYFYNFERLQGQDFIPANTKFIVNQQIGPEIQSDWSNRTAHIKFFSNLTGDREKLSNPNLVIQCTQDGGLFLRNFSIPEIKAALKELIDIK